MPIYTVSYEQDDEPATSARSTAIEALSIPQKWLTAKDWTNVCRE